MTAILQTVVNAVTLGSLYALVALGIALIFGIMRLFNFAHGDLIMLSALTIVIMNGQPWPLMVAAALIVPIVGALLMDWGVYRHIRSTDPMTLLVASFGVSMLILSLTEAGRGNVQPAGATISPWLSEEVEIGGVIFSHAALITILVVIALLIGTAWLLRSTVIGIQMRAAAEDFEIARLLGVRANVVVSTAFGVSGLLAGAAAVLLMAQTGSWSLEMGIEPVIFGFVAAVIGGMGSLAGAVLGGYALGVVNVVLQTVLPDDVAAFRSAFLFILLLTFVVIRPQGLLPSRSSATRAG